MKNNLLFDFTVDKENSKVLVKREFEADQDLVWEAWTDPKILDQWWAPKPWVSKTKSMNFEVGGRRLYCMCGPNGEEHWGLEDYTAITPKTYYEHLNAFCDSEGHMNPDFPRSLWKLNFTNDGELTLVEISIHHKKWEDLEKYIEMGFKEGFTMCLENLDVLLQTLKTS